MALAIFNTFRQVERHAILYSRLINYQIHCTLQIYVSLYPLILINNKVNSSRLLVSCFSLQVTWESDLVKKIFESVYNI